MIGQRIESRPEFPLGAILFAIMTLGFLITAGMLGDLNWAAAAIMPASIAVALFLSREPVLRGEFNESGFEADNASKSFSYHQIRGLSAPLGSDFSLLRFLLLGGVGYLLWQALRPKKPSWDPMTSTLARHPIHISHDQGSLKIPRRLNVPSHEVYRFLLDQAPQTGSTDVHKDLTDHLIQQLNEFGPENVWSFRASVRKLPPMYRKLRFFSLGMLAGVAGLVGYGFYRGGEEAKSWFGGSILFGFFGVIFFLASFARTRSPRGNRFKGWKQSSLVIGPKGLALVQGEIRGELQWPELWEVTYIDPSQAPGFTLDSRSLQTGIKLKVDGATILIPDIYDCPLFVIYQKILTFWAPSKTPEIDL